MILLLCSLGLLATVQAQISRNPCVNFSCENNGRCTAPADRPYCECTPEWVGDRCEINRNPCYDFECLNGGSCDSPTDYPFCICPTGFTGRNCESKVVDDVSTLCDTVRCTAETECRVVYPSANGSPRAGCVDMSMRQEKCRLPSQAGPCEAVIPSWFYNSRAKQCQRFDYGGCQGNDNRFGSEQECVSECGVIIEIDDVCLKNMYLEALLVEGQNGSYTQQTCATGMFAGRLCPLGSSCVENIQNSGVCCAGKSTVKPGSCPAVDPNSFGVCGGTFCSDDLGCTGDQKCCASNCGGQLCTNVDLGCGLCPRGEQCVQRPVECPPGRVCTQALVPTCVPEECVGCRTDQECRQVPGRAQGEWNYFCAMKQYQECSATAPCSDGKVCLDAVLCQGMPQPQLTPAPAPRSKRQASIPVPAVNPADWYVYDPYCARNSECVAPTVKPGTCPRIDPGTFGICGGTFCKADNDCEGNQKCCASACGGELCTTVDLGCGVCPAGEQCVQRPVECPRGRVCTQALVPTCVRQECVSCRTDQECRQVPAKCERGQRCEEWSYFCAMKQNQECTTDKPCKRGYTCSSAMLCQDAPRSKREAGTPVQGADWYVYDPYCARETFCVLTTTPTPPKDSCGGCPFEQNCESVRECFFGIFCSTVDKCVADQTVCPLPCPRRQECQWVTPRCRGFSCWFNTPEPEPTCVDAVQSKLICPLACLRPQECQMVKPPCKGFICWFRSPKLEPTCVDAGQRTTTRRPRSGFFFG